MERHEAGGMGYLRREEFTSAAQDLFAHAARGVTRQIFAMVVLSPIVAFYTRRLVDATLGRLFPTLGKGFQKYVPDFIFAPALATAILTTATPILFDRYDRGRESRKAARAQRAAKKE